jgi:hypothetical protein
VKQTHFLLEMQNDFVLVLRIYFSLAMPSHFLLVWLIRF